MSVSRRRVGSDQPPRFSWIMIFLDSERFIDDAIASVVAQAEVEDWELILIDDGSTDASTEKARRWEATDPDRIRYVDHPGHVTETETGGADGVDQLSADLPQPGAVGRGPLAVTGAGEQFAPDGAQRGGTNPGGAGVVAPRQAGGAGRSLRSTSMR